MIAPRAPGVVSFNDAQGMVNAIWAEMGLKYPPAVEPLPKQASSTAASANRLSIFLPKITPCWCLLHEIAHSMTSTEDGQSDGHGRTFMGLYLQLISRYLRTDLEGLMQSVEEEGIGTNCLARPIFVGTAGELK